MLAGGLGANERNKSVWSTRLSPNRRTGRRSIAIGDWQNLSLEARQRLGRGEEAFLHFPKPVSS